MTVVATLALQLVGFAALALSMSRHYRDLFGTSPRRRHASVLRYLGWGTLALALVPAFEGRGVSVGIVLWLAMATVAALAVAMALTFGPRSHAGATPSPKHPGRAVPANGRQQA